MIYTLTVNPAIDYIMELSEFPLEGATNRAFCEAFVSGGKGINVSLMLKTLGIESTALGFVAGETGKMLSEDVKRQGIRADFAELACGHTRVNVKLKTNGSIGKETEINGSGPRANDKDIEKLLKKLESAVKGDIIIMSGSLLPGMRPDFYAYVMSRFFGKASFIADARGTALLETLAYKPLLVKPNLDELSELAGRVLSSDEDIKSEAKRLILAGAQNVIVSLGSRGAMLFTDEGEFCEIPVKGGKAVSSVGAGDSMVAGFAAGITQGLTRKASFELACRAAEATAMCRGIAASI